jgi:hypothetical protein
MNGYKNLAHYNVAVWIHNDEKLYNMMIAIVKDSYSILEAVRRFYRKVNNCSEYATFSKVPLQKTPDGFTYTFIAVQEAMEGQELEEFLLK